MNYTEKPIVHYYYCKNAHAKSAAQLDHPPPPPCSHTHVHYTFIVIVYRLSFSICLMFVCCNVYLTLIFD